MNWKRAAGLLADVVPVPVADRGYGRGRAEGLEDLIGAHALLDLSDGPLIHDIAALEFLAHAMQPATDEARTAALRPGAPKGLISTHRTVLPEMRRG